MLKWVIGGGLIVLALLVGLGAGSANFYRALMMPSDSARIAIMPNVRAVADERINVTSVGGKNALNRCQDSKRDPISRLKMPGSSSSWSMMHLH